MAVLRLYKGKVVLVINGGRAAGESSTDCAAGLLEVDVAPRHERDLRLHVIDGTAVLDVMSMYFYR